MDKIKKFLKKLNEKERTVAMQIIEKIIKGVLVLLDIKRRTDKTYKQK